MSECVFDCQINIQYLCLKYKATPQIDLWNNDIPRRNPAQMNSGANPLPSYYFEIVQDKLRCQSDEQIQAWSTDL